MSGAQKNVDVELTELLTGSQSSSQPVVDWTPDHEKILIEWADKAMCYRWLHAKAHAHFKSWNAWFTIPVIIMSTLTGTANFAQDRIGEEQRPMFQMAVGGVNIFAGILTTIQQFLKIGELNEAHRVASIAWDKFYRNIKVELAKSPAERQAVLAMLKHSKEEFDRLMETSPMISEKVTDEFKKTFSGGAVKKIKGVPQELSRKQKLFEQLKKPEICDELVSVETFVFKASAPVPGTKGSAATKQLQDEITRKKNAGEIERIIDEYFKKHQHYPTPEDLTAELADELQKETEMMLNLLKGKVGATEDGNVVVDSGDDPDDSKV